MEGGVRLGERRSVAYPIRIGGPSTSSTLSPSTSTVRREDLDLKGDSTSPVDGDIEGDRRGAEGGESGERADKGQRAHPPA